MTEYVNAIVRRPWHGAGAAAIASTFICLAAGALASFLGNEAATACGAAFFLAGLGHGAAVEDATGLRRYTLVVAGAYIVFALAIAAVCIVAPAAGLIGFLALSAWHFSLSHSGAHSGADASDGSAFEGPALGLIAIGGSTLFWPDTTRAIFTAIIAQPFPDWAFLGLQALGLLGLGLAFWCVAQRGARAWMPIFAAAITLAFTPILAVGTIFFALHALPESRRQFARFGSSHVLRAAALPVLLAAVGAVGIIAAVMIADLPIAVAAALAIGLATPHMIGGDLRA